MTTVEELRQALERIDSEVGPYARALGVGLSSERCREYRRLKAELRQFEANAVAVAKSQERDRALAVALAVALPTRNLWRPFILRCAQHVAAVAVEHGITLYRDDRRPRGSAHGSYACIPPILTEGAYGIGLHEEAHAIGGAGDGQQHRHVVGEKSIISPLAEIAAWRWAMTHAIVWTAEMHAEMQSALRTYHDFATVLEHDAIAQFIRESAVRIRPAPDTSAGREARARFIQREDRVRAIHARPELERRLRRLREAGL